MHNQHVCYETLSRERGFHRAGSKLCPSGTNFKCYTNFEKIVEARCAGEYRRRTNSLFDRGEVVRIGLPLKVPGKSSEYSGIRID